MILKRFQNIKGAMVGALYHHDTLKPFCMTLEAARCIPPGAYTCKKKMSAKRGFLVIELIDVPERTHIQIHPGNSIADTVGCILVGSYFTVIENQMWLTNSKKTFEKLMLACGNTFTLTVVESCGIS